MKCNEVQEIFGSYWDLPSDNMTRLEVDEHIQGCASCAEEFDMWKQSTSLIQAAAISSLQPIAPTRVSNGVMNRIYSDEAWRIPVTDRTYSNKLRRNLTAVISFCLALFVVGFLCSVFLEGNVSQPKAQGDFTGLIPVANAAGEAELASAQVTSIEGVAVASLSDPIVLKMGVIQTTPDYLLAFSLLGLICALLIMNWLSRIKA